MTQKPPPPGIPWASVLDPHIVAIWDWRKKGKTLREIAQLLATEKGVTVAHSTVSKFIDARKRRFARLTLPDLPAHTPPVSPAPTSTVTADEGSPPESPQPAKSDHDRSNRAAIEAAKAALASRQETAPKPNPLSDFDPNKPLIRNP